MSVTPIVRPLSGERLLGVEPKLAPFVDADWHRRLRLYTGRALSDVALIAEQTGRAGRLATRGQMVSPGVVSGLEAVLGTVDVPQKDGKPPLTVPAFHIAAGFGIAASGEDVFLSSATVVPVQDVRVYAPAAAANASGFGTGTLGGATADDSSTVLRRLGARLGDYAANNVALPQAAILVLQPVLIEISGRPDLSTDPCAFDPSNESLEDFQIVDGCRVVLYSWPTDWLPLPTGAQLRNQIAAAIFRRELGRNEGEPLPWEELGVPIGLAAFDNNYRCTFIDRYSVVRLGGSPKRRTALLPEMNQFVWQARMQQLAEHMADVSTALDPATLAAEFRFLPPAGLLPKEAVNARAGSSLFFPGYYTVSASPIPLEQIDAPIAACAGLAPYDLYVPDAVEIFVPVPQDVFDPNLLIVEKVDPAFQLEVDRTKAVRLDSLERRNELYQKADALIRGLRGKGVPSLLAQPDANAMADETPGIVNANQLENPFGTTVPGPGQYASADAAAFKSTWSKTPLGADIAPLDDIGLLALITDLSKRADQADDTVDIGFLRANTDIYRFRQLLLNNVAATRLATSPALAQIAQGESATATRDDLAKFLTAAKTVPLAPPAQTAGTFVAHSSVLLNAPLFALSKKSTAVNLVDDTGNIAKPSFQLMAVQKQTAASLVSRQASERLVFNPQGSVSDIQGASPVAGDILQNFRTISIAKRLEDPVSTEARKYAVAARQEAVQAVLRLSVEHVINMDDIPIPGIVETDSTGAHQRLFGDLRDGATKDRVLSGILNNVFDPLDANADEATVFANGVRMVEQTISTMRAVEARIKLYRNAIADMQAAVTAINSNLQALDTRLKVAGDSLAEARQDVSTTLALLADETARVKRTNQTRDAVISAHVTFLVYTRPRRAETIRVLPSRFLDPGLVASPVPVCLNALENIPPDIAAMVKLFREAPVTWFTALETALTELNRLDHLRAAIQISQLQAQATMALVSYINEYARSVTPGRLQLMIEKSYWAQQQALARYRTARAQFDLSLIANRTWQETFDYARAHLSVGDLMDGQHGTASLSRAASNEMDNVARIATCICNRAGDVLPVVRLAWAEAIGQYDGPVNLRDLSSLPRWQDLTYVTRRELQSLADWLYSRVNPTLPDALAAVGDLIRVSLLLASHAPVNRLIAGSLISPAPVVLGGRVKIQVDHTLVQMGMQVLFYRQSAVVARGVVEDLATGLASARIIDALDTTSTLDQGAVVHFVPAGSPQYRTLMLKGSAIR